MVLESRITLYFTLLYFTLHWGVVRRPALVLPSLGCWHCITSPASLTRLPANAPVLSSAPLAGQSGGRRGEAGGRRGWRQKCSVPLFSKPSTSRLQSLHTKPMNRNTNGSHGHGTLELSLFPRVHTMWQPVERACVPSPSSISLATATRKERSHDHLRKKWT
jgi:hypothetical protein